MRYNAHEELFRTDRFVLKWHISDLREFVAIINIEQTKFTTGLELLCESCSLQIICLSPQEGINSAYLTCNPNALITMSLYMMSNLCRSFFTVSFTVAPDSVTLPTVGFSILWFKISAFLLTSYCFLACNFISDHSLFTSVTAQRCSDVLFIAAPRHC